MAGWRCLALQRRACCWSRSTGGDEPRSPRLWRPVIGYRRTTRSGTGRAGVQRHDGRDEGERTVVVVGGVRQGWCMATEFQVTFDSADPAAHAAFWAEAVHYVQAPPPAGFDSWAAALDAWGVPAEHRNDNAALVDPDGAGPRLFFQKVPEPKTAKNRVHLDLRAAAGVPPEGRADALEAECTRLVALGARQVQRLEPDGINDVCIVMHDPEGNEFCPD